MSFHIVSGDIPSIYKLYDNVLMADGHPPIAINEDSVLDYQEISHRTDYGLSWVRVLPALAFGFLCFSSGVALAFAAVVGLRVRHFYTFRMKIRYYGTFVAVADKKTYQSFLQSYVNSRRAA